MSDDRQVQGLRDVLDAFNRHDLDAIMSHFGDDCVFEAPRGPDRWTFAADGLIVRKDSYWKIRET
jgi:hypothetical protein